MPDGTREVIATDHDAAGDSYAAKVAATFLSCEVEAPVDAVKVCNDFKRARKQPDPGEKRVLTSNSENDEAPASGKTNRGLQTTKTSPSIPKYLEGRG